MSDTAKFRFNFKSGDIEIEGSEEFVREQIAAIGNLVELWDSAKSTRDEEEVDVGSDDDSSSGTTDAAGKGIPDTFGEYMHSFRSGLSDVDTALLAARFVQSQSSTNDFKTLEVNKTLREHGIKLQNPSRDLGRLASRKLIFQTRKVGKLKFVRVSQDGLKHLETLKK